MSHWLLSIYIACCSATSLPRGTAPFVISNKGLTGGKLMLE